MITHLWHNVLSNEKKNPFAEFHLARNRSFDLFLLEKGSELLLIMQEFLRVQPTLTVTHETQISLALSVRKISDARCQKITASDQMRCSQDKIEGKIRERKFPCLPFQYKSVFPKLYSEYQQCKNEFPSSAESFHVRQFS